MCFCNDTASTEIYTLSLRDALPIFLRRLRVRAPTAAAFDRSGRLWVATRRGRLAVVPPGARTAEKKRVRLGRGRSEADTSGLQSRPFFPSRLLLSKKKRFIFPFSLF